MAIDDITTNPGLSEEIGELSEMLSEITSDMIEEIDEMNLGRYHRECLYDFLVTACTAVIGGIKYAYRGETDSEQRDTILKAIRYKIGLYGDRVSELEAEKYAVKEMTGDDEAEDADASAAAERFEMIRTGFGIAPQLSAIMNEIEELKLEADLEKMFYTSLFSVAAAVIKSAETVYKAESDVEKCREILKPILFMIRVYEQAACELRASRYQHDIL